MRAPDLFGVGLRLMGVWFFYNACYAGLYLGMKQADLPLNSQVSMTQDKLLVGFYLALAFVLLVLANKIVSLCYGADKG